MVYIFEFVIALSIITSVAFWATVTPFVFYVIPIAVHFCGAPELSVVFNASAGCVLYVLVAPHGNTWPVGIHATISSANYRIFK